MTGFYGLSTAVGSDNWIEVSEFTREDFEKPAQRSRCLCGKARYATEGEARRAVKRMKSNGRSHSYAGILHPYLCPERRGIWHVGHTDE